MIRSGLFFYDEVRTDDKYEVKLGTYSENS